MSRLSEFLELKFRIIYLAEKTMQVILGANGVIGVETSKALAERGIQLRQVSRNPKKVNNSDELLSANLLDKDKVFIAVEGAEVAYLCAGLKYDIKVW